MKRLLIKMITVFFMVVPLYLPSDFTARCETDDNSCGCDTPIDEKLDYSSEDRFAISLSKLASEYMSLQSNTTGHNDEENDEEEGLKCFGEFLENEIKKPLSVEQHKQVLFLLGESRFRLDQFKEAYQCYLQLKLLIKDKSSLMHDEASRMLNISEDRIASQEMTSRLEEVLTWPPSAVIITALDLTVSLILAGMFFAGMNKKKYPNFIKSKNFLYFPIEDNLIELEQMRSHDGRVSESSIAEYKSKEGKSSSMADEDEKTATARLLVEGHEMIKRVNHLAPYPIAITRKIPLLNRLPYFWNYTIFGFLLIAVWFAIMFWISPEFYSKDGFDSEKFSLSMPGFFMIAAFVISSLTCLQIMAKSTINALDEIVSMLEPPRKKNAGEIPDSVLQIEKNMDFLFRSPWQFFIVLIVFSIIIITRTYTETIINGGADPFTEKVISLIFIFIIVLIGGTIIWMLIGSVYVLNDISKMQDLAINPLSPLKTMGLEKWTSVIGTYGLSSSIVLSFGCSIKVVTSSLDNHSSSGDWFWFILILPLLFFYWIYPYLKLSSMVKQQKTDRMQIIKTKISQVFNEWMLFEEKQLERMRECQEKQALDGCSELFDFRKQMAKNLKPYLEPMNKYYEIFRKIDESPHSYINFFSVVELVKALGIPSLFALLSAWLL